VTTVGFGVTGEDVLAFDAEEAEEAEDVVVVAEVFADVLVVEVAQVFGGVAVGAEFDADST